MTILDSFKLDLSIDKEGFNNFMGFFKPSLNLLTVTIITIPVYIALETLISSINNQEGKALIDLRKLLNEPENLEIHKKLRGSSGDWSIKIPQEEFDNKDTWRKIDNYLGILELINILIEKGVISKENFNTQFGYRIDNVFENADIRSYLEGYEKHEIVWKELYSLFTMRGLKNP